MKKIVVFGGSGFLGKHIIEELLKKKYFVRVFDKKKLFINNKNLKFVKGKIENFNHVKTVVKNCDYVINLAGISDIGEAIKDPTATVKVNILGNLNILEACKFNKIKKYIFASTIYVLSNQGGFYRTSKASCELYIQEFKKRFNLDFTIVRYGSIFGEGAPLKNGVSKIISNALIKNKLTYSGTNKAIRNFIHVEDAAKMTIKTLSKKYNNLSILITGNKKIKIKYLMNYLKKKLGIKHKLIYNNKTELGHYDKTPFSYEKIRNKTLRFKQIRKFEHNVDNLIKFLKNEKNR